MSPGQQPMAAAAPPAPAAEETEAPSGISMPHPGDSDCDGSLALQAVGGDRLVGTCSECGEEFTFRLFDRAAQEERATDDDRPPRRERGPPRPRFDRGGGGDSAPPSRPCRQCGGALSFETGEDGTVTGHCASCGNTFSLAPRADRGGRSSGGGGGGRYGPPRGGGRGGGGGGGFRPGGFRGRPSGGGFRRRESNGDDSDDRRRRRFRRDD
jgi:translation initiation factor IF-2